MSESTKQTGQEMALKDMVREEGEPARHELQDEGRVGGRRSREKTVVVDLGSGPEKVIMIDWADGDPEVGLFLPNL
jgi:hypothetical protein